MINLHSLSVDAASGAISHTAYDVTIGIEDPICQALKQTAMGLKVSSEGFREIIGLDEQVRLPLLHLVYIAIAESSH